MKQILKTLPAFLILILGICLSFWIYSINKKAKFKEKENQISAFIENSYRDIQKELAVSFSSVEILRSIFEEQENISKEEFKNFTTSLLKSNPGIKALSWVPKITNEERTAFENKISKTLNDKVVITKRNNQNEAIANEENSFYFPVTYIEPFNENKKALGYNIYSDSSRQKTIDLAINKGKIVITPRISLVQDTARYGFLGISAVYSAPNSPKTIENVKGLISTVFEFDILINDALTSTKDSKIAVVIFDITNNKKDFVYGNKVLFGKTNQYTRKKTLAVGGRIWELNFIITPGYYQIANIKAYLIGGIAISFLLFMLLLVPVIKERRRIILFEKLFKEQKLRVHVQESLSESEEKYQYMFDNNPQPMWIYDMETLAFLEINNAAINHYGYTREEFLSMTLKDIRPKEDLDALLININQTGQPLNFAGEWRHLKKNGEIIYVEITSHLITFNGQKARHVMVNDITERKLAEEQIKQSEEKFRNAVMNAPFPIMIHSEKGEVVLINDTWNELSGYSHQEIPTIEKWTELAYGEKIEVVKEDINLLYEIDKRKDEGEYEIATKNGQKRIWAFSSAPIGHDSEKNRLVISMALDITERKKAEENLKKSEENLRLSTELANVAVWEYDFSTNTMERSKNHDHLYGLPPQPVWEMGTFVKATHPLDREISSGFIQESVASGGPDKYTFDFRVVFPDKSTHWLNVIGQVMERNSKGEGVIVRGTLMDITERKKAEDELKRNEQILKLFVKYSPAAIAMFDKEMKYIVVSNRFKLDYELGEKNIIGHSHYEIFPELKVEWKALHKRCLAGEILKADEEQFVQNSGSIGWLRWEIHPWYDKEGEIGGLILFSEVITDRKKAQEEIKILNAELEQRVIDRTAQLDAANKELQTFTYSVSHDLKAPLRGIDGYSKLLEELYAKDLNEEAKYFVKTIRNGTKQMNRLIEDLLDYSRLERATLRMESIQIKKFINTIIDSFEIGASSKKTLFDTQVPDIEIIADSKGLSIALRNITENAIKFSAKNKNPKIEISLIEEPKFWLISMKDNGIGFDMKYKDRIFEIFQQLNLPEEFPGTGIGLAMVHKSMEKMGGKIWAESTVGNGATFYLQIPKIKI